MYSPKGYRKHKRGHDSLPCKLHRSKEVPQGKGMEHNYWLDCKVHWLIHIVRNEHKIFPPQVGVLPAPECRKHLCMAVCRCQDITAAPSMMSGIRNSLSLGFAPLCSYMLELSRGENTWLLRQEHPNSTTPPSVSNFALGYRGITSVTIPRLNLHLVCSITIVPFSNKDLGVQIEWGSSNCPQLTLHCKLLYMPQTEDDKMKGCL